MKKRSVILLLIFLHVLSAGAARFSFLPSQVTQPDGTVIQCFASGDEYFNWLHDSDGFTIIQAPDGYYYWGKVSDGDVVPTGWRADQTNPAALGLDKWAKISLARYNERRAFYTRNIDNTVRAPHLGTMNNLVIYIRFSDDTEFITTRQAYDNRFNAPTGISLKSYYTEVSYEQFTISSTHYPECPMTVNLSYQDYHPRSYFQPYNATTNPNGYASGDERTYREHTLLKDAVTWVNLNSPVPGNLDIDGDSDGNVDNVCFIIRGGNDAWAELLWAHRWSLFSYNVYINGKRVLDYTFQPETQVDVQTLCHEMFHALGAPDLYHYSSDGKVPVGDWDLMESGGGHMGAFMKWKYTESSWIAEIPEITVSGTYTLHPLASPDNNCYKIASPYSTEQFFVVEYRKKEGTFEGSVPGSGLLVYRIDESCYGNAGGPPDEVYVYRPGGTLTTNGTVPNAYFSAGSHRTKINDQTSPSSFLQDGSAGGLRISKVTEADTTISFTVDILHLDDPSAATATSTSISEILVKWKKNPAYASVLVAFDTTAQIGTPVSGTVYQAGNMIPGGGKVIYAGGDTLFNHTGLTSQKKYYYKVWSLKPGNAYSPGLSCNAVTLCPAVVSLPFTEGFEAGADRPSCWYEDNDDPAWQFFAGNGMGSPYGYPATAHSGDRNACLIDATTMADFNTLTTPMIDLAGYTGVHLKFWLFMQKWGSRQDELKVYYRTNPGLPWILLDSYTTNVNAWTEKNIPLPAGTGMIQIGFSGNARWGLGICIDDIVVEGTPLASVTVAPSTRDVVSQTGMTTFEVTCPAEWSATSDAAWCTVTPTGTGNGSITALFEENPVYSKRTATITVTATGFLSQTVTVTQAASNLSADALTSEMIRIFPNPANSSVRILDETGAFLLRQIILTDFTGRALLTRTVAEGQNPDLDLSSLAPGTYFMRLTGARETLIRKVVLLH